MEAARCSRTPSPPARSSLGTEPVRLRVPAGFAERTVEVAGDFTCWAPIAMLRDGRHGYGLDVCVPPGRRWRYRFCVDHQSWRNDPDADEFEILDDGSVVSVRLT